MKMRSKISKGGQISIPAAIRRRWGTSTVTLEEQGGQLVISPAPDDPIEAAEGALEPDFGMLDVAHLRNIARRDDQAASERRRR